MSRFLVSFGAQIQFVERSKWDNDQGLWILEKYGLTQNNLFQKHYCLCALSAMCFYLEDKLSLSFAPQSISFRYHHIQDRLQIDPTTIKNLELLRNLGPSKTSLFQTLNQTKTQMGARLLRSTLLQPKNKVKEINRDLDAVQELIDHPENLLHVQRILNQYPDMDHMIASLVQITRSKTQLIKVTEQSINNLIKLKHGLETIKRISLDSVQSKALVSIKTTFEDPLIDEILGIIYETIDPDTCFEKKPLAFQNQKLHSVRAGINGLLDVARRTYREANDDVYHLLQEYKESYQMESLDVKFTQKLGFRFILPSHDLPDNPEFINVSFKGNKATFNTMRLMSLNDRIKESMAEAYLMSETLIAELLDKILGKMIVLYKLSESLGLLDLYQSFAHLALQKSWIRPQFGDTIAIKAGVHPMMNDWVSNDVFSNPGTRVQIITGPNRSGKSSYLNQIALICIMAHMGCFVPADYCAMKLLTCILSRIGRDNSLQANASSFAIEMKETHHILEQANKDALVIIDELGRGTQSDDGLAVSIAVIEQLVKQDASVFFVTHFTRLAHFLDLEGMVYVKMGVTEDLEYQYSVTKGVCDLQHYGIRLAQSMGFDHQILDEAKRISTELGQKQEKQRETNPKMTEFKRNTVEIKFAHKIIQLARHSKLPSDAALKLLKGLALDLQQEMNIII